MAVTPPPARNKKSKAAATAAAPPGRATAPVVNKTFQVKTWSGDKEGEKVIAYADSGMGKTTLASMAPSAVFIGLDDGGRKILNPKTNESLTWNGSSGG